MVLDPAFRSRLREAIQQSLRRHPGSAAFPVPEAEAAPREEPHYEPVEAGGGDVVSGLDPADPDPVATGPAAMAQVGLTSAPGLRDGRDAWIARTLGGWWQREGHGICLVVDRDYDADRRHGDHPIGHHAATLARYGHALSRLNPVAAEEPGDDLFADLPSLLRSPTGRRSTLRQASPRTFGSPAVAPGAKAGPSDPSASSSSLLFFDLETTGLSGGAGTCAFLIGFGWFEGDHFRTRQYFLSGFGHEPAMLRMAADGLRARQESAGELAVAAQDAHAAQDGTSIAAPDFSPASRLVLATFNGRTFDLPLIENRYLLHRQASPFECVPHLDVLHPARRLWRYRPRSGRGRDDSDGVRVSAPLPGRAAARARSFDRSASAASCALGELEQAILGVRRQGDVPGGEIPARYFHYVRTGDVRPLEPVLAHNRDDLLSLAALTGVVAHMLEEGPRAARNAHECVALGRLYERTGAAHRAADCYETAVAADVADDADPAIQREALRRLACRQRRDAHHDLSAATWQRLLDLSESHGDPDAEALHALAVHYEHRAKNLDLAHSCVQRLMTMTRDARLQEALRHRLQRIERKKGVNSGVRIHN